LLVEKRVRIDGKVVSDPHSEVLEFSRVEVDEQVLQVGKPARYFMLHKPPAASVPPAIRSTRPCSI
jgi:16S rRNA pseudouridine516 synthase